ncbi:hypothetical protein [Parvularcula oceani]|jgi:hypothetical protein|uniref:hypothetical protein n=1 Tax=Parvularcula oceani TaxID=1247963 RepID=UPI00068E9EE1|nr:hypothetical protein [Parvularcula oceani]
MFRLAGAAALFALMACSQDARLPPLQDETLPPVEQSPDWEGWGEDRTDLPPGGRIGEGDVIGVILDGDEIRAALAGTTLQGCYPNGQTFAERLAADGRFFDAADDRLLGQWSVSEDTLCFSYAEAQQAGAADSCFAVSRLDDDLHFYAPDYSTYVASTRCPMRLGE